MLASIKAGVKNAQVAKVEITLLIFLLIFGIPMIVLIPPGAGYDEEDHLARVWELSAFSFIPGQLSSQEMKYPALFRDFAYRQQGSSGVVGSEFWQKYGRASLYEYGVVHREINTKSVYSPALLLPQALTMRLLGRRFDLPALPVFYACRFASLLSYLILVWLAIRQMPFGKWILLVLAVSPMALFQAATISPDAISNAIGFLFIAGCLRTAQFERIGRKEFGKLVLFIFLLFWAKVNLVPLILLPFLLIPPSRFAGKGMYILLLGMTVLLFLIEVAGWNAIATRHMDSVLTNDANPTAQILSIARRPLAFLQTFGKDLIKNGSMYFQGWINGYGYYYWTPPQIVAFFFLLSLVIVFLSDSAPEPAHRNFRVALILVFTAAYIATIASLYLTFTPVGSDQILGVQGRYFIPPALLLMLTLAGIPWLRKFSIAPKWTVIFLATALSLNVAGIFLVFHVNCGLTYYQTGLCYRPLFKDFPSDVYTSQPVSANLSITQELKVKCDGLTEVRLLPVRSAPDDPGTTHFVLQDSASNQTLLDTSVSNDRVTTDDWYPLPFPPDWSSAGKQYILKISSTSAGLKFMYTPQSEFDLGNLYENGAPLQDDLVLQYGCANGLRKIWLTSQVQKP